MNPQYMKWATTVGIPEEDQDDFFDMCVDTAAKLVERIGDRVGRSCIKWGLAEHEDAAYHMVTQILASWALEDMAEGWGWDEEEFTGIAPEAVLDCLELQLDHLQSSRRRRKRGET